MNKARVLDGQYRAWIIGLVALFALASCAGGAKTLPADEALNYVKDEATTFASQVDALTLYLLVQHGAENLLVSLSNHNYAALNRVKDAAYIQDMDAKMKAASSEAQFEQAYAMVIGKISKYVSRQMTKVTEQEQFRTVVYDAQFEQEEHVTVRVVYNIAGDRPLVSGLWFDSPKLRQQ